MARRNASVYFFFLLVCLADPLTALFSMSVRICGGLENIFAASAWVILQKAPLAATVTMIRTPAANPVAKGSGAWKEWVTQVARAARVPVVVCPNDWLDVLFLQMMLRISAKKRGMNSWRNPIA